MKVLSEACSHNRKRGKQQTPQHHFGRRHQLQVQGSKQLLVCSRIFLGTGKGFGKDIDNVETFVWATDITRIKYVMAVRIQSSSYTATFRFHFLMLKGFKSMNLICMETGMTDPNNKSGKIEVCKSKLASLFFSVQIMRSARASAGAESQQGAWKKNAYRSYVQCCGSSCHERLPFLGVQIHTNYISI